MIEMISSGGASISCSHDDEVTFGRQILTTAVSVQFVRLYPPERKR